KPAIAESAPAGSSGGMPGPAPATAVRQVGNGTATAQAQRPVGNGGTEAKEGQPENDEDWWTEERSPADRFSGSRREAHAVAVWRQSMTRTWPVMKEEASLARKIAGPAISSGLPQRPMGTLAIVAWPPSGESHRTRFSSVAVQPGQSAFTRTPARPHSLASVLVSETTAALAAPYGAKNGAAARPATEAMLITEPPPRAVMCAPAAWQIRMVASRLSRSTFSQPGSRRSRNGTMKLEPPALLTTTSRWPSRSIASVPTAAAVSCPVRSAGISTAWRPVSRTSLAVAASP